MSRPGGAGCTPRWQPTAPRWGRLSRRSAPSRSRSPTAGWSAAPAGRCCPAPALPAGLTGLGLRTVHPDAAHPLLARLGAAEATPRTVLDRPEVRAAVDAAWDADDPGDAAVADDPGDADVADDDYAAAVADAVLGLVAAAGLRPGELRWLSGLRLADDRGRPAAADELVLPGSVLARLAESTSTPTKTTPTASPRSTRRCSTGGAARCSPRPACWAT